MPFRQAQIDITFSPENAGTYTIDVVASDYEFQAAQAVSMNLTYAFLNGTKIIDYANDVWIGLPEPKVEEVVETVQT
jgi:hypothetical protein